MDRVTKQWQPNTQGRHRCRPAPHAATIESAVIGDPGENSLGLLANTGPWGRSVKSVPICSSPPCPSGDMSAEIEIAMDYRQRLATDIAKRFLASHDEPTREDSRLFEDLQQFALEILKAVGSGDSAPTGCGPERSPFSGRSSWVLAKSDGPYSDELIRRAHYSCLPRNPSFQGPRRCA